VAEFTAFFARCRPVEPRFARHGLQHKDQSLLKLTSVAHEIQLVALKILNFPLLLAVYFRSAMLRAFLLILWIAFSLGGKAFGQIASRHVRNYGPEVNKAGEVLGMVAASPEGVLFFSSEKGVLVYDGDQWKIIPLTDELAVRAIEFDQKRNRLWVGGIGTFGYLASDSLRHYRYVPISDSVYRANAFKQVWQILVEGDSVTFMTNEGHFIWHKGAIVPDPILQTYVFRAGAHKYYSQKKGGLYIVENGQRKEIWNQAGIKEAVYYITKASEYENLLFTPYNGVYVHDTRTQQVRPHSTFSKLLTDIAFYEATEVNDSVLALGTWYHGILFTNREGQLLDQCGTNKGLASDGISDIIVDPFGKLWAATDYGVSVMDLSAAWPGWKLPTATPPTRITQVTMDNERTFFPLRSNYTFTRRPKTLRIQFATPGFEYQTTHLHLVRLEGVDTSWHQLDGVSHMEYANLANGHYTFLVKRVAGRQQSSPASITFRVQEPWYTYLADNWDYLVGSVALGFLLVFAFTYRLRANQQLLTQMVAEKTREIEQHEKELLAMNKNLKEANEELDILLYRSSHDLVSPVKSIKGLLHLIRLSPSEMATYLPMMEDRIARLEQILLEINSYVRHVKGEPVAVSFNLLQLVRDIRSDLEFMEQAKDMRWELNIDPQLWVESDRDRWRMALANLISNAVKYSDPQKEERFIKVSVHTDQPQLIVTVTDNGQGIHPEYQPRLFEMFYRASEGADGLGLGLFLVKKIVDSLHGSITVESEPRRGTRFTMSLPVRWQVLNASLQHSLVATASTHA
jgi:signal transduction histidine kinase